MRMCRSNRRQAAELIPPSQPQTDRGDRLAGESTLTLQDAAEPPWSRRPGSADNAAASLPVAGNTGRAIPSRWVEDLVDRLAVAMVRAT